MSALLHALLGPRYRSDARPEGLTPSQMKIRDRLLREGTAKDWEDGNCLCGASGGRVLSEVDRHGLPYRKVLCVQCGLLRASPRWTRERYARFYAEDYRDLYSPLSSLDAPQSTLRRLADGPGAKLVSEFVMAAWRRHGNPARPHPTLVEIGAGGGWNLARLPKDWHRIGFDSDERFLRLGRETFDVDMRQGFFEEALPTAANADCVLMSHVLEHVDDPVATLQRLSASVRPDALILVEVPGIFRLHKTSLDPMRYWQNAHTYTFCARTVADTCRRAGLEPVAVDEWIRLVLRPSRRAHGEVQNDKLLATSVERYLRYCERLSQAVRAAGRTPAVGPALALLLRRGGDGAVRIAEYLGLVRGIRAGHLSGEQR